MLSGYQEARKKYETNKDNHGVYDSNMEHNIETDVISGSWVLIIKTIPVKEIARPVLYGIYWGIPNEDRFGRQTCKIRTTEDVTLLNHEFSVINDLKLEEYKENGWELDNVINTTTEHKTLNLELIEQGKSLCEEEREIIWALQLDGLTEEQSCEEYFFSRHTDDSNYRICFLPNEEIKQQVYSMFGATR